MADRDSGGRFTGGDGRKPQAAPFDLAAALRRLFAQAERAGDYSGAASVARVISTLESNTTAPTTPDPDPLPPLELWTVDEKLRLRECVRLVRQLKREVRERLAAESGAGRSEGSNAPTTDSAGT
jgi:hypothetical protein